MDEKGSSTFPFHNLPPEPKKTSQRSFLFFFTFPYWIKENSVVTLAIHNITIKRKNNQVSSPTVSQRVIMEAKLLEDEWVQNRFDQLNLIEEKRMMALCHGQL